MLKPRKPAKPTAGRTQRRVSQFWAPLNNWCAAARPAGALCHEGLGLSPGRACLRPSPMPCNAGGAMR
eukprot:364057-Chlamydomonas_euryale.AAC.2